MKFVLLTNVAATFFMLGVIWFVQVVKYPLFASVGLEEFGPYHRKYLWRTGSIVGPVMATEGITAFALAVFPSVYIIAPLAWAGFGLLLFIYAVTLFIEIPAQRSLQREFTDRAHRLLVVTNWARTLAWTARAALIFWLMANLIS